MSLLSAFPKQRPILPQSYQRIHEREYQINRTGATALHRASLWLEEWMHDQIVKRGWPGRILEIGAGTLNHVAYERRASTACGYDIIEPRSALVGAGRDNVDGCFNDIGEIHPRTRYDRIVSIATFEHLVDLPAVAARAGLLLADEGALQVSIPTEGGFLWGLGWRMTSSPMFWRRYRMPYSPVIRHEHINTAREIGDVLRIFFDSVEINRFPLPAHHASIYTYLHCTRPLAATCQTYLDGRGEISGGLG
jgi:hypothetical protein